MNFQEHFQKYPELLDSKISGQIRAKRPTRNTQANYQELKRLADLCHIPNDYRKQFNKLSDLLGKMGDRIDWALAIQKGELAEGVIVKCYDGSLDKIVTIASDYSIRLEKKKGAFNPKRMARV